MTRSGRRRGVVVLAALTLLVGCRAETAPTVAEGAAPPATPAPAEPGVSSPRPASTMAGPAADPATAPSPASSPAARPGSVGSSARAILRADGAAEVELEILVQTGAEPRNAAVDHLASLLRDVSGKPVTTVGATVPGGEERWTPARIAEMADRYGGPASGTKAVVRLLFVHGSFADGDDVLGVSVRGDLAAIFTDEVDDAASPLVSPARIETAVATHEVGHLLGLVDLVLRTGRADPDHPGHSTNPRSVMYWAVESDLVTDVLTGGPPTELDAADRADLATIRGG